MSMPITSATSGSSTRRWTRSAPHQRATPVTRIRRFRAMNLSVWAAQPLRRLRRHLPMNGGHALISSLDDVALHAQDGLRDSPQQRALRLAERELELAQERVDRLHGLDRVADVYVGRQRDPVQGVARRPPISEVDVVMRGRAQVGLVEVALHVGKAEIE